MVPKKKKIKNKKISFMLSWSDWEALRLYAQNEGCGMAVAARRAVKDMVDDFKKKKSDAIGENQLTIFDSIQTDILGGASKAK